MHTGLPHTISFASGFPRLTCSKKEGPVRICLGGLFVWIILLSLFLRMSLDFCSAQAIDPQIHSHRSKYVIGLGFFRCVNTWCARIAHLPTVGGGGSLFARSADLVTSKHIFQIHISAAIFNDLIITSKYYFTSAITFDV